MALSSLTDIDTTMSNYRLLKNTFYIAFKNGPIVTTKFYYNYSPSKNTNKIPGKNRVASLDSLLFSDDEFIRGF